MKVEVFPDNDPKKVLNPERPILYVLADRGVSDLLVLTEVCSQHGLTDPLQLIPISSISNYRSVYSIASSQPFTDWLRRRDKNSQLLGEFVDAGLNDTDFDLQIVPVSVFWGRPLFSPLELTHVGISGRCFLFLPL